jgi:hypothetical protein
MILFEKSDARSASSSAPQNLQFERQNWSLFRTVEGLQQRAGVPRSKLRADNVSMSMRRLGTARD